MERTYKARDKTVQKMTRDGLAERNLAEGTERGISQRPADFSFRQAETGRAGGNRGSGKIVEIQGNGHVRGNRRGYSLQTGRGGDWEIPAPLGEHGTGENRLGMVGDTGHEAEDKTVLAAQERDGAWQGGHVPSEDGQLQSQGTAGILAETPEPEYSGTGEPDGETQPGSSAVDVQRTGTETKMEPDRLGHRWGGRAQPSRGVDARRKKRIQRDNAEAWRERESVSYGSAPGTDEDPGRENDRADTGTYEQEGGGYPAGDAGRSSGAADRGQENAGDWRTASHGPESAGTGRTAPHGSGGGGAGKSASHGSEPGGTGKQADAAYRKYQKAEKRLDAAERKLERAKEKLPIRRRLKLETTEDSSTGKRKSRLRFETEFIPENREPSLLKRTGGSAVHTAQSAASAKIHQKVREAGQDNVGVESAHKAGAVAGRAAGRAYRTARKRLRTRPYRAVRRAERGVVSAERNAAYKKLLAETPELQKKALAKWLQKQKIKRKYAAAAGKAAKGAGSAAGAFAHTGNAVRRITEYFGKSKAVLALLAAAILALALSGSLFTSCSSMFMGMGPAVAAACYTAEDTEINRSGLRYTELETDLQLEIAHTERDHPGYDEYRYNIGEIGHNPYELMGYLSAVYNDFTYAQVEAELYRLFGLQYELTREAVTETRTCLDEEGEEQEYDWHVLKTVLTVRPLSGILSASLAPGDQTERYGIYMQTCGGRQNYGSPFDFPWLGYVTSPYGYRVHPLSGDKDLHRGIDIAAAEGTPILAVQDGHVASAGEAGGYGLCLVIEGEDGYQSRYAHCSSIAASAGQEVRRGEVVAYVGNTGDSTGPHLHLEAVHNGEYLNPYFFVDNGGNGFTAAGSAAGSPRFAANPGEPMGDSTFGVMLEVAERYIGYPYVWGGSSPDTSFDCSGYVSYVINQSGAGSVGRQTAQGLCNLCTPVSWEDLQPGDLVFFTGTYSSATPVSHVGIYVGGGKMISAGDPIGYADIGNSRYWKGHFYCGGRLP